MSVVQRAKERVTGIVDKLSDAVSEKVSNTATTESRVQAVTISRPRGEVLALFQDANRLSEIFGDVAEVRPSGPDHLRWKFTFDGDGPEWECVVATEGDTRLRFSDVDPDRHSGVVLEFRDAPQDRGTEVIARVGSPAPGALTGALTFKALYRARALLTTGEVPTIEYNPSARHSDR
jgi:uncharacterized membrane protein